MPTTLLRLKPGCGPKHYVFTDPDTKHRYESKSRENLIKQIIAYRSQNELAPIEYLNDVLDNYWAGLPENLGEATIGLPLRRGVLAYLKGGIALLQNVWYGEKNMVDQATADARAAICIACPKNVAPDKGPFLAWSDSVAEASVGDRKSVHHDKLFSCIVCTCTLKAKVHWGGEIKCSKKELLDFPTPCWQKDACLAALKNAIVSKK